MLPPLLVVAPCVCTYVSKTPHISGFGQRGGQAGRGASRFGQLVMHGRLFRVNILPLFTTFYR